MDLLRRVSLVVLAGLVVFSARVQWIGEYGSRIPFADEVSAEFVANALRPRGGWPGLEELVKPHNEHRILWQRLAAAALIRGNDMTWDSHMRAQFNALIAAAAALLLALVLRGRMRGFAAAVLFLPALAAAALPIAYSNLLFAFQTSFHLQMLLSFAALAGLAQGDPRRVVWWLGLVCGLAALFTNGSGFFTAPVLLAWTVIWWLRENRIAGRSFAAPPTAAQWHALIPQLAAVLVILIPGILLIHRPEHLGHQTASGISEFLAALVKHLAWPSSEHFWLGPVFWAPSVILAWLVIRGHGGANWLPSARAALLVCGWVLLNFCAMSWARGAGAFLPLPRYYDFHLYGLVGNTACLTLIWLHHAARPRTLLLRAGAAFAILWFATAALGATRLATESWQVEMPETAAFRDLQERNIAAFTAQGDRTALDGQFPRFHLPYFNQEYLTAALANPSVVALLPAHLRPMREATAGAEATGSCTANQLPPGVIPPPGQTRWVSSYHHHDGKNGTYRSGPITPRTKRMRLWYLGMRTGGAIKLELKPVEKGRTVKFDATRRHGTSVWQPLTVEVVPGRTYRLEFRDRSENGWAAFTLPVDEPPLSHLAEQIRVAAPFVLVLGPPLLLLLALPGLRCESPSAKTSTTPAPCAS